MKGERRGDSATTSREGREERRGEEGTGRGKGDGGAAIGKAKRRK